MQRLYLKLLGYNDDVSIGECYHYGWHVARDLRLAHKYYVAGAMAGTQRAFQQLAALSIDLNKTLDAVFYHAMDNEQKGLWIKARDAYEKITTPEACFRLYLLYDKDRYHNDKLIIPKDPAKKLFWLRIAAISSSKNAINLLEQASQTDQEIAYLYGNLLRNGETGEEPNIEKAIKYFFMSAREGKHEALQEIETLSSHCDDTHIMSLANLYQHTAKDFLKAIKWFVFLAERNHKGATTRITSLANRSAEHAHMIGDAYEHNKNFQKAFEYFYIGCEKGFGDSFKSIENYIDDRDYEFKLEFAKLYCKFNYTTQAILLYKKLILPKDERALRRMNRLAHKVPEAAYNLAEAYDKENNPGRAYHYYLIAYDKKYPEAEKFITRLQSEANNGIAVAQYYLGCVYYHKQGNEIEAIRWALLAANQEFKEAQSYLDSSEFSAKSYLNIANQYAKSTTIKKNSQAAMQFYKKAIKAGDVEAEFHLGEFYLNEHSLTDNINCGISQFINLAQRNHATALTRLEELANAGHVKAQVYLGCERGNIRWALLAAKQNSEPATEYLRATSFKATTCVDIATLYTNDEAVRDINAAIEFYTRAVNLDDNSAALKLAELYDAHSELEDHKNKAIHAYIKAAQLGSSAAVEILEKLAQNGSAQAQYGLGCEYYNLINKNTESIYWVMQAADQGHKPAIHYLDMTEFTVEQLKLIARRYQLGDGVDKNTSLAKNFYTRAAKLLDHEAAYLLGEIYLQENEVDKSLDAFENAAKWGNPSAVEKIESLATVGNPRAQLIKANYYHSQQQYSKAIQFALIAADQEYRAAIDYLAESNFPAEWLREIATRYSKGDKCKQNREAAIKFYEKAIKVNDYESAYLLAKLYIQECDPGKASPYLMLAARGNHQKALDILIEIAEAGDAKAQYDLACEFYHRKKNYLAAIDWAMRANNQGYGPAKDYLCETVFPAEMYLHIAQCYQKGEGCEIDVSMALRFYQKAIALKDGSTAYQLADFYFSDEDMKDIKQGFIYLSKAAQWGNDDALANLQNLADEEANPIAQYHLGCEFYHHRQQRFKAIDYAFKSATQGFPAAINYLQNTIFNAELYAYLANKYVDAKNYAAAVHFYEKAIHLNHKESIYYIGAVYLILDETEIAFAYFIQAAQYGNRDALTTLECIAQKLGAREQGMLSELYRDGPFPNLRKALEWSQIAAQNTPPIYSTTPFYSI